MAIPKYVEDLLHDSRYTYYTPSGTGLPKHYAVGYTIDIYKPTWRTQASTFRTELNRLQKWVERNGGEMHILTCPNITRYANQSATVTITDPVMQLLEHLIKR